MPHPSSLDPRLDVSAEPHRVTAMGVLNGLNVEDPRRPPAMQRALADAEQGEQLAGGNRPLRSTIHHRQGRQRPVHLVPGEPCLHIGSGPHPGSGHRVTNGAEIEDPASAHEAERFARNPQDRGYFRPDDEPLSRPTITFRSYWHDLRLPDRDCSSGEYDPEKDHRTILPMATRETSTSAHNRGKVLRSFSPDSVSTLSNSSKHPPTHTPPPPPSHMTMVEGART